ncbi:epidermal retinol dehydrogenase 2-like [Grus americana]|uniref:Epidermal retinol dehydrogenase 2-like n=2 Tax=Grus TaxID=9114 RepID=A0ABC9WCE5_GRUJA|nr:epidermal retinol dehydrogenase 2-like [Grus americana]XP_054674457.1 epidermal retinol dehydrogenase 2-like [Grus americana]
MFNFRSILKILQFLKLLFCLFFENLILLIFPRCKKTFAGEIVLITGSANGIGRQIALKFAPLGATLVLWDINDEGNKETSILAQNNGAKRVFAYHCDCSNREEVYEQADKVRKEVGDVTILINNAGILLGKKFCDIPDADFEKTLRVNFLSQVWTCKAFLPAMIACNRGHLVSMGSVAGLLGVHRMSDYAGSKFAVIGMMEAIDSELYHAGKRGIKTTVICPYFINTELAKGFQTQNTLFLPVYDAEYIASKIMDAIQKEKFYLIMPLTLRFIGFKTLIPRKMVLLLESCLQIASSLDKAFGQKKKD